MKDGSYVVVIDPGHGGENLGAEYESFTEKDMTMQVAKAMYEKLSGFEGIEVHLTRTEDKDLTLKERVEIAEKLDADFFFCLHFNMSVNHDLYGAETWISSEPSLYAKGYDFSKIEMEALTGLGLFDRGIKTKLKKNDKDDYYGIIRAATGAKIPSVIIEHCHLDNLTDYPFYHENTADWLKQYGELDALSVAKYFQLKNPTTGEDFSTYEVEHIAVPKAQVKPDKTDPETCILSVLDINQEEGYAELVLEGKDEQSPLIYYSYSFDQGETVSERFPWDREATSMTFKVPLSETGEQEICGVVYNLFDRLTVSNVVTLPVSEAKEVMAVGNTSEKVAEDSLANQEGNATFPENQGTETGDDDSELAEIYEEIQIPAVPATSKQKDVFLFAFLALCILFALFVAVFTGVSVSRNKRRRQRK